MNLCNIQQIRALLQRHGFRFSKSKGQNFLTAAWVPEEICTGAGIDAHCGVLEIGPGIGPLTDQLCRHAAKVVAVEDVYKRQACRWVIWSSATCSKLSGRKSGWRCSAASAWRPRAI